MPDISNLIGMLFQVLLGGAWIACLVLVIIEMFNKGQKGLGIVTIVLSLCFGIGGLIALIWGWSASGNKKLMTTWSVIWLFCLLTGTMSLI